MPLLADQTHEPASLVIMVVFVAIMLLTYLGVAHEKMHKTVAALLGAGVLVLLAVILSVIDEVAGQWLTLAPFAPDPVTYLVGFVLFRAADIVKPWPANWADRELDGGLGVMLDDIFAGIYAGLALFAFLWITG